MEWLGIQIQYSKVCSSITKAFSSPNNGGTPTRTAESLKRLLDNWRDNLPPQYRSLGEGDNQLSLDEERDVNLFCQYHEAVFAIFNQAPSSSSSCDSALLYDNNSDGEECLICCSRAILEASVQIHTSGTLCSW